MLKIKLTTTKTDLFEEIISKFDMRQGTRFEIGSVCCGITYCILSLFPPPCPPPTPPSIPINTVKNISNLEARPLPHGKFIDSSKGSVLITDNLTLSFFGVIILCSYDTNTTCQKQLKISRVQTLYIDRHWAKAVIIFLLVTSSVLEYLSNGSVPVTSVASRSIEAFLQSILRATN